MSGQIGCDRLECAPVKDGSPAPACLASIQTMQTMREAVNRTTERMEKAARAHGPSLDFLAGGTVTERTINDPAVTYVTTNLADSILKTIEVAKEVVDERSAQEARWGEQNHPDGTSAIGWDWQAENAKFACEEARRNGRMSWRHILLEEVFEAFAEEDPEKLRAELLQVSAVAQAWVEAIDRRLAHPTVATSGSQSAKATA